MAPAVLPMHVQINGGNPSDFTMGCFISSICGPCGLWGYALHPTQYYVSGFWTGFGIWLVLIALLIVIQYAIRSSTGGIILGVLLMLGGVAVAALLGVRRKKQLDDDRLALQLPAVQPAMN